MKEKTTTKIAKIAPLKKASQKKIQKKSSVLFVPKKVIKAEKKQKHARKSVTQEASRPNAKKNPSKKKAEKVFSTRIKDLSHDPRGEDTIPARPSEAKRSISPPVLIQSPLSIPFVFERGRPIRDVRSEWSPYQDVAAAQAGEKMAEKSDIGLERSLRRKRQMRKIYAIRSVLALLVLAIPVCLYGYFSARAHRALSEVEETKAMLAQVSAAVVVPDGAVPQIFKVTDPQKLSAASVAFSDLKIGDRILYFKETKIMVLYSIEKKKIIAIKEFDDGGSSTHGAADAPTK